MDIFMKVWDYDPTLFILMLFMAITIAILLGIVTGNRFILGTLIKMGFPAYSGKIAKDYNVVKSFNNDTIGWLHVPDTCYSPVMAYEDGKYKHHNFLHEQTLRGELYLSGDKSALNLRSIAKPSDHSFPDLTVINGTSKVRTNNIRESKFTLLTKYINSDLRNLHPDIILLDNGKKRIFNFLFAVEIGVENSKQIAFKDRESFLKSMKEIAFIDTHKDTSNNIIILRGNTELDTLMVFLVEKEG